MGKRVLTGIIALAFVCSSLFIMTSCAKKQISATGGGAAQPAAPAKAAEAKKVEMGATEDYKAREAARQARLRELERAQLIRNFESEHIYFDFDKYDLKPPAKVTLRQKADFLKKNPQYSVRIEGHCDERGTNEYNLALGERRANAAKKFLMALGVSESRITTISYGEERPVDPRHNEEAWAKNRRDEFKLIK